MYKLLNILCLLLLTESVFAGDPEYPAAAIPAELKEKAHAVKRWEETNFRLTSAGEARANMHYVITVLDAHGDDEATLSENYDKLIEIRSIRGALYDADGKIIKKLKQSDIEDVSAISGMSLITDNRIKRHTFNCNTYPYTVEYEIEMRFNCTYMFPDWIPQANRNMSVEHSRMVVSVPQDYQLRYRQYNHSAAPQITTEKDVRTYVWEAKHLKVLPDEVLPPAFWRRATYVNIAPSNFVMGQYKGSMASWEELGKFAYTLNEGRDVLPENVKQTVHQLTDGLSTPAEKIKRLYSYLQQNTRYISIQLGIGGFQTFDAAYVAGKGYGDCKALTNYMHALLKEAGITSYCTWVNSGEGETEMDTDFPSDPFDHVILCVPQEKDTTWLECTSQFQPVGYLGAFTSNRPVLLLTENGGKLVRTPAYGQEQNQELRRVDAKLTPEGNLQAQVNTLYTGEQQDDLLAMLHRQSKERIMEWIRTSLPLPSYDVTQYDCKELERAIPAIDEQLGLTARNYASISGKRMFLELNILNKSSSRIDAEKERRSDIHLSTAYRDEDTVNIALPAGYTPESIPKGTSLSTRFGTYTSSITIKDNIITYIRSMRQNAGNFPAGTFEELEKFFDDIYKADRCRVVLVKKE